ncbi:MAG: hypothetical protein NDI77_07070 [Geobacteraceae bacterium]|nr:hypothetical protein [Geobacteraceae bacterium]
MIRNVFKWGLLLSGIFCFPACGGGTDTPGNTATQQQSTVDVSYKYSANVEVASGIAPFDVPVGTVITGTFNYDFTKDTSSRPRSMGVSMANPKYFSDVNLNSINIRSSNNFGLPAYYDILVNNDSNLSLPISDTFTVTAKNIDYAKSIGADQIKVEIKLVDTTAKVIDYASLPEIIDVDGYNSKRVVIQAIKDGVVIANLAGNITSLEKQ